MFVADGVSGSTADALMYFWFFLVALSTAYVAYDAFTKNPELTVMKWGWVLVTAYIGPIGAALYVLSCKEPRPGTHERFVTPLWKQAFGSTIHCVAGDATGIVIAAVAASLIGLPPWGDSLVEYLVGFGFGLLIFQALFMRDMLGGSYLRAVRSTVLAEWLSMNCVMGAMVAVLVIIRSHVPRTADVADVSFWATFSLAVLAGLAFSYPVNVWLVANHLKHGMGTVRVLGKGGDAVHGVMATNASAGSGPTASRTGAATEQKAAMSTTASAGSPMAMPQTEVTAEQKAAMATLTVVFLAAGVLLAAIFGQLG
ncbi:DUF4396 domain-containing protein [Streptomyces pluripotens]|uniref:DUF4396 domain-containing protein n=2 Tax=Streptomyces TaxID=1883 RepID=A0A221P937_9ACTN|nr:copper oxidase [Streptomyces pluripotens]ASN28488.1 DUF4396 domain-containing protein [Streptomyces pluripotens]KIE24666.1 multicopper oxidase [Streptomyces sp. MUSC 125]MCH0560906.1 DUF4396 domain-containing protein [Streptomyces sp. MUM 16J]